jgi:hypothetical protein
MLRHSQQRLGILVIAVFIMASGWFGPTARAEEAERRPPSSNTKGAEETSPPPRGLSQWAVDDADPEKSVPTPEQRDRDPLQFGYYLMDLTEKAGAAAKQGDHRAAAKYYAALAKAVPDRSIAFSKLCSSYEALGQWEQAVDACRAALGRPGVTVGDSIHFVHLVLDKRAALDTVEVDDLSAVVENLKREEKTKTVAAELQCDIGLRLEDVSRLEECTTALAETAPQSAKTISYQWALSVKRRDFGQARQLIERAKAAGMPPEGIARMDEATMAAEPWWQRKVRDRRFWMGMSAFAIAAIVAVLLWRRSTLRAAPS